MTASNLLFSRVYIPGDQINLEAIIADLYSRVLPGLVSGGTWYFGPPDGAGVYPEGTWRIIQVGVNLEVQVLLSSVWTPASKFERPIV